MRLNCPLSLFECIVDDVLIIRDIVDFCIVKGPFHLLMMPDCWASNIHKNYEKYVEKRKNYVCLCLTTDLTIARKSAFSYKMAYEIKISSVTPIFFTLKFDVYVYALFWKRKEKNLGFTDVSKTLKKIFFLYKVYKTDDLPLKFQTAVEMLKTRWPLTFFAFYAST